MRRMCGICISTYYKSEPKHRCVVFRGEVACVPKDSNKYMIVSDDFTFLQKPHIILYR